MKINFKIYLSSLFLFVLVFLSFYGCGSSSNNPSTTSTTTTTTTTSADSYKVYSVSTTPKTKNQGNSPDILVVLPSEAAAPANSNAVENANVTFVQDDATSSSDSTADSITVTTDSSGSFTIPDEIKSNSQSEDSQPNVVVSDPSGTATSVDTTLPVTQTEDTSESPLSLKIIPKEFKMFDSEIRVFHAIKVMPSGKVVEAKNVTWNCDGAGNGILSKVEEGANKEYIICKSSGTGSVTVTASVDASGGLSDKAAGTVISKDNLIIVEGTVKDSSGNAVGKGYMMNFDLPPTNGLQAFHFVGPTDTAGKYKVYLPGVPSDQAQTIYKTLIGTPKEQGAKLNTATPTTFTVAIADNGTSLTGKDFTIGVAFTPMMPPPPIAKIIRGGWDQVNSIIRPRFFEPFHGIRILILDNTKYPDGTGQIDHKGMFKNWCYDKKSPSVTITPPAFSTDPTVKPSCPNTSAPEKIEITLDITTFVPKSSAKYTWVKSAKFKDPTTGTLNDFKKVATGIVNDTITCDSNNTNCYISKIDATKQHNFAMDNTASPISTSVWHWTRTLGSDTASDEAEPTTITMTEFVCSGDNDWNENSTDIKTVCGTGMPFGKYSATRVKGSPDWASTTPTLLFNFYGNSSQLLKEPDGTTKEIANTICSSSSPCTFLTDGSGTAKVDSSDGKVKITFNLMSFKDQTNIATGTLTLTVKVLDTTTATETEKTKTYTFTIDKFGMITITNPDGTTEKFPVFV